MHRAAHQLFDSPPVFTDPLAHCASSARRRRLDGVAEGRRTMPRWQRRPARRFIVALQPLHGGQPGRRDEAQRRAPICAPRRRCSTRSPMGGRTRLFSGPHDIRNRSSGDPGLEARATGGGRDRRARQRHLRPGQFRDARPLADGQARAGFDFARAGILRLAGRDALSDARGGDARTLALHREFDGAQSEIVFDYPEPPLGTPQNTRGVRTDGCALRRSASRFVQDFEPLGAGAICAR